MSPLNGFIAVRTLRFSHTNIWFSIVFPMTCFSQIHLQTVATTHPTQNKQFILMDVQLQSRTEFYDRPCK